MAADNRSGDDRVAPEVDQTTPAPRDVPDPTPGRERTAVAEAELREGDDSDPAGLVQEALLDRAGVSADGRAHDSLGNAEPLEIAAGLLHHSSHCRRAHFAVQPERVSEGRGDLRDDTAVP